MPVLEACRQTRLIPAMFGYVLDISADRDNTGEGLGQLAEAYELRAVHSQARLRAYLTPLAVITVGCVLLLCILGLFCPALQLYQALGTI